MHPQARKTKQEEPNEIFLPPKQQKKESRRNSKKKEWNMGNLGFWISTTRESIQI
jgi:hypothetical protein